ncbi:MAG: hypothetical protein WBV06_14570 [Acidimicrobiia bacterium]|jgi:hypothetical protein
MAEPRDKNFVRGIIAIGVGVLLTLAGALWAHFTGADEVNSVGQKIYTLFPRGWAYVLLGQLVSIGGVFVALGGVTLAFLYEKKMTWARAAIGAFLFTASMIILFGVIPNQWLTYARSVWQWTDQKIVVSIPSALIGGNQVRLSAAALTDIVNGTYVVVLTAAVATVMIRYQKRDEIRASRQQKQQASADNTSAFGRPLRKVER